VIALDTNVLLRYVIDDDPDQSARAARLIDSELTSLAPGFVSLVVLCETIWAMTQTYRLPRANVARTLIGLLTMAHLEIEAREIVQQAASLSGDIADAIIHLTGRQTGCTHTLTLDKKFARLDGVELLA
jgi:predicted nucleic-acid-binding protein